MSLLLALPMLPLVVAAWLSLPSRAARPATGWVVALVAALPVAVAALAGEERLELPELLVKGSSALVLDVTSRAALLLFGGLWLTAALLLTRLERMPGPSATALLLALSGAVTLALADGGPLIYAGMLATGYGLYAIMAGEPGDDWRRAGRTMIVLLVVSDLLIFEVLLSATAHPVDGVRPGLVVLALVALILRGGVPPAHVWLPPALLAVGTPTAVLLVAVPTGAALFGVLKLVPAGLPEIGAACALVGLGSAAWALVAGLAQAHSRATLGYALAATAALLVSAAPAGTGHGAQLAWLGVALLASCAALPLVAIQPAGWARDVATATMLGVHGLAGGHAAMHAGGALPPGVALLTPWFAVAATLLLTLAVRRTPMAAAGGAGSAGNHLALVPPFIASIGLGFAWWVRLPDFDSTWVAPVAVTLGLLVHRALPLRARPHIAPGDLLGPVERGLGYLLRRLRDICECRLPRLRDRLVADVLGMWDGQAWSQRIQQLDLRLRAWPATSLMMLLVALGAALLLAA
jgi:hypothetical protein